MQNKLIIIPARAGSKGIPQKSIRLVNGKPLIFYAIANAKAVMEARVVVSTDSPYIKNLAELYGVETWDRPMLDATDEATLDQVVFNSIQSRQSELKNIEFVITLQPTSPLLKPQTLLRAVDILQKENIDSLISVNEKRHHFWVSDEQRLRPFYGQRLNRQQLEPIYEENGAIIMAKKELILKTRSRISSNPTIFPLPSEEGVDIDDYNDLCLAQSIASRRKVVFVVCGNKMFGMGHVYRAITLSHKFLSDRVLFVCTENDRLAIQKLKELNYPFKTFPCFELLTDHICDEGYDLVVNDILDTELEYVKRVKDEGRAFVVNFEDFGSGSSAADIVFNALYEWSGSKDRHFFGYRYECLREDIYLFPVRKQVSKKVRHVLVGFGGTDVNSATPKIVSSLLKEYDKAVEYTIVLGIGSSCKEEVMSLVKGIENFKIVENVLMMSKLLSEADLVISGNGRMVYEAVALGTPLMVFSQNERETGHVFSRFAKGVSYQGYVKNYDESRFLDDYRALMKFEERAAILKELTPLAYELRRGVRRVSSIINERFEDKAMFDGEVRV